MNWPSDIVSRRLLSWRRTILRPAVLFYLLMIPMLWVMVSSILLIERQRTLDTAIQQGSNLVRLFEQNTVSILKGIDRTLLLFRREYEDAPDVDLGQLARRLTANDDPSIRFALVEPDGNARGLIAYDGTIATAYVGDRDYFQRQRDAVPF